MLQGDFRRAWQIADAVLAGRDKRTRDDPARPYHERWVWDGQDLTGQDVLVRCYHGLGDTLQFVRYLPALRRRARHVTLEAQPELAALLTGAPGADLVVPFDVRHPTQAATAIEIMELPHALRLGPDTGAILHVLPATPPDATAGVCWQAGSWDASRSVPLDLLMPVLPRGAVSLQPGADGLPNPLAGSADIRQTAALVAGLDCVVTVDTMVAHLAGLLGRPAHILLKHEADWRWGLNATTPWYPRARLYRQPQPGDWPSAISALAAALRGGPAG